MSDRDHHLPCPCGRELADECRCPRGLTWPPGGMAVEEPVGSRVRLADVRHSWVMRAGLPYRLCDLTDGTGFMVAAEDVTCPDCLALLERIE